MAVSVCPCHVTVWLTRAASAAAQEASRALRPVLPREAASSPPISPVRRQRDGPPAVGGRAADAGPGEACRARTGPCALKSRATSSVQNGIRTQIPLRVFTAGTRVSVRLVASSFPAALESSVEKRFGEL